MSETYGTLECGHELLIDDPDMDVRGSHYCPDCAHESSFQSFHTSRLTEEGAD